MSHRRLRAVTHAGPLAAALAIAINPAHAGPPAPSSTAPPASASASVGTAPGRLAVVERVLAQDQGDWQVDYCFKNAGATPLALPPAEVSARVEGWLSNSKVAVHAHPRRSECAVAGASGPTAYAEVISSADESRRCRERLALRLWSGPAAGGAACTAAAAMPRGADPEPLRTVTVEPGGLLRVRLRLEHQHFLYGDYDPLLGRRDLELKLGATTLRDSLPLDREQYLAQPGETWPEPAEDDKDTRHFVTGPDSLHLEADAPGNNSYRFPERKVRYSSRMRLRFWYMVAPGTEGDFKARVAQYRESPNAWKILSDGGSELTLKAVGRWTLVEKIIRTEAEATTLALEFRITTCDIGEAWVDDVSLEPLDAGPAGP